MKTRDRILAALLVLSSVVTVLYWINYYSSGDVRVSDARWYTAFEGSFTHVALRASNGQPLTMTLGRGDEMGSLAPGAKVGIKFASADALVLAGPAVA